MNTTHDAERFADDTGHAVREGWDDFSSSVTSAVTSPFGRAQREDHVSLIALSALELCVLGAPKQPFVHESVTRAWARLGHRVQEAAVTRFTRELASRGLLTPVPDSAGSAPAYSLSPELGVILAARTRPGFLILNHVPGHDRPQPVLYALGDQHDPAQALVAEVPAAMTDDDRRHPRPEALRTIFGYLLFSKTGAADFLARWNINPPQIPRIKPGTPRMVTLAHPQDAHGTLGYRISIRGDGTRARVTAGDHAPETEYDLAGLHDVMLSLINGDLSEH
jgi:hypothetical protein